MHRPALASPTLALALVVPLFSACQGSLGAVDSDGGAAHAEPDAAVSDDGGSAAPGGDGGPRSGGEDAGVIGSGGDYVNQVTLPVEVMGGDGAVETVEVHVSDASDVDRLWVQAHNAFGFHGQQDLVSIRVNDGPWVDVNNDNVTCRFTEARYGCVGGAASTIRFTIPATNVVAGANTIAFRFNGSDGFRSGFRVLLFDFLRASASLDTFSAADVGVEGAIDETGFVYEDRSSWTAPEGYGDAESVAAGAALWSRRDSLLEAGSDSRSIRAACSDCHASDGRDLAYFGYSNRSIVARSRFHGLSEEEGKQIAAYIRSIELRREDGSTYVAPGTPWDPPYQPGPGLDERPVQEWAAGAGLEAVLDRGAEMIPHLFPDGISLDDVHTESTLNMRELPVPIQFADWNTWLPVVHPMDARIYGDRFEGSDLQRHWREAQELMPGEHDFDPSGREGAIMGVFSGFDLSAHLFMESSGSDERSTDRWDQHRSVRNWVLVKTWELVHGNNLENDGEQFHPSPEPGITYGEARSWPTGRSRCVFDISPHISGDYWGEGGGVHRAYGNEVRSDFFDTEWYYKQMVLNAGGRNPVVHNPMDWKYHFDHLGSGVAGYGIGMAGMYLASFVKMIQQLDNQEGVSGRGWFVRHVDPFWLGNMLFTVPRFHTDPFVGWTEEQRREAVEVVWRAYMIKTTSYEVSELPRGGGESEYDGPGATPTLLGEGDLWFTHHETAGNEASGFYRMTYKLDEMGVDPELVDLTARWGEQMWPNGDWERWMR
jgi:hypothetical protein